MPHWEVDNMAWQDRGALPINGSNQPTKKKDFWTDQISTGGGIAGSLAGAAGGAAIGSVVPGIGTVIGGLIGGVLGGAGGSAAGQLGENYVSGEKDLSKDVGSEALWGGITGAPPIRLLKGVGAAGKILLGGAKATGEQVAKGAAKTAFEKAFTSPGILSTTLKNLGGNIANKTYSQAFTVPRKLVDQLKPEQTAKELISYGISGSLDSIGKKSTDAMKTLGGVFDKSVSGVGGQIKAGDPIGVADAALKGVAISKLERDALRDRLTDIGTNGVLPGYGSPSELMDVARGLETDGFNFINAGTNVINPKPNLSKLGDAYVQAAREIEDNIYTQVSNVGSFVGLKDKATIDSLNGIAKGLGDKFSKTTNIDEVRSLMAPFVRTNKIIKFTESQALSAGTQGLGSMTGRLGGAAGGFALGGPVGAGVGFLAEPVVAGVAQAAKAPVATTVGRGINALSNKITPKTTSGVLGTAARQFAGRQLGGQDQGTPSLDQTLMNNSGQGSNSLFQQQSSQTPTSLFQQQISGTDTSNMGDTGQQQSQSPYPKEALMYDVQRDPTNASKYFDYYNSIQSVYNPKTTASQAPFSKPTAQVYAQATTGLDSVNKLIDLISKNSNLPAQNTTPGQDVPIIGSLISAVAGTNEYRATTKNILNSIARINTGANMPVSEQVYYEQTYLPQPGDNEATIASKIQNLQGFFAPLANYNQYSSGSASLEDIIMQQSQGGIK